MKQYRLRPSQGGKMFSKPVPGLCKLPPFEEGDFVTFRTYFNGRMRQVFGWIDGVNVYSTPGLMRLQEARTGEDIYFDPESSDVRKLERAPEHIEVEYPSPRPGDSVVVISLAGTYYGLATVKEVTVCFGGPGGYVKLDSGATVPINHARVIPPAPKAPVPPTPPTCAKGPMPEVRPGGKIWEHVATTIIKVGVKTTA